MDDDCQLLVVGSLVASQSSEGGTASSTGITYVISARLVVVAPHSSGIGCVVVFCAEVICTIVKEGAPPWPVGCLIFQGCWVEVELLHGCFEMVFDPFLLSPN